MRSVMLTATPFPWWVGTGSRPAAGRFGPGRLLVGDAQLAAGVEAGALLGDVRRHRPPPRRLDVGAAERVARLRRVPDRDPDDLVAVCRVALVGAEHAGRERARAPGPTELLVRARLEAPGGDPHVLGLELHA